MDVQFFFNLAISAAAFFGGWVLTSITRSIERLDRDVRAMPLEYVSKADYRSDLKEIKELLSKIFEKLDGKADKP
jgi:hypothetical protein